MTKSASDVIACLQGKTLATAESCTGGGIGEALTAVPGASKVYKGGVISYCNEIKEKVLSVSGQVLSFYGAVSSPVAEAMAKGARTVLNTDIAVSVNGTPLPSTSYTYDSASGLFTTTAGSITVPAATSSQNPVTGEWTIVPGQTTLTITGTI